MENKITSDHYELADAICRKEYEKRFNTDLSKPTGRLFRISNKDDQIKLYSEMAKFWHELGEKYVNKNGLNFLKFCVCVLIMCLLDFLVLK